MSSSPIRIILDPRGDEIGDDERDFLAWLGGPTEIRISGRDPSRCRAVSALLHGNEPSSVIAVHRWLRSGVRPAVDVSIFVLAVEAALIPPGFAHRIPPGRRDLNRCFFPPFDDQDGKIAEQVLARLRSRSHEALVDLHNNTGQNPAYGIINRPGRSRLKLVEFFTNSCCILSNLRVGALTEAIMDEIPSAAVECGHAGDQAAHDLALAGIERFLGTGDLALERDLEHPLSLFDEPIRVRVRPGTSIAFGHEGHSGADLTLRDDIDNHNFQSVERGTVLGWVKPGAGWPIEARGADDQEISREHFEIRDGGLVLNSEFVPIMMTTNTAVAMQDCLCYLMHQRDWYDDLEPLRPARRNAQSG